MSQIPINDVYKVETCGTGLGQAMVKYTDDISSNVSCIVSVFDQIHVEYNIPETEFEQCAFNLSVQGYVNKESKGAEIQFCAE